MVMMGGADTPAGGQTGALVNRPYSREGHLCFCLQQTFAFESGFSYGTLQRFYLMVGRRKW